MPRNYEGKSRPIWKTPKDPHQRPIEFRWPTFIVVSGGCGQLGGKIKSLRVVFKNPLTVYVVIY